MEASALKQYQTQLKKTKESAEFIRNTIKGHRAELTQKEKQIHRLEREIKNLTSKELTVSEHAILRYCERVLNIDIEEIRNNILNDELKRQVSVLGNNGTYPVEGTYQAVIRDGIIVTIK